jgi:hypothetical protein
MGTPPMTAKQIAADAADHELKFLHYGEPYVRYQMHMVDAKGDQTRDIIQSRDGIVARLIARDNRPLTPEEDAAERTRLQEMLDSPDAYKKHVHGDSLEKKTVEDIIRQMPEAMIFTFVEGQPQRPSAGSAPQVVIDYKPDPAWHPPTMASDALIGMQGRMWVDARTHNLVALDGNIFRPINIGLFVAHIYPGGDVSIEQGEVVPGRWFFTHFVEHITVRVPLIFRTIHQNGDVTSSHVSAVNPMSYQEAIHLLLATPLPH